MFNAESSGERILNFENRSKFAKVMGKRMGVVFFDSLAISTLRQDTLPITCGPLVSMHSVEDAPAD